MRLEEALKYTTRGLDKFREISESIEMLVKLNNALAARNAELEDQLRKAGLPVTEAQDVPVAQPVEG